MEFKRERKDFPVRDLYMEGRQSLLPVIKEIMSGLSFPTEESDNKVVGVTLKTTSIVPATAEIVQIVLSDIDGKVLFSSYVKPYAQAKWHEAERLHHVSPAIVKDAPYLHQIFPEVCRILNAADFIVAYDAEFVMALLKTYGYDPSGFPVDVMRDFAKYYGEVSTKYHSFQFKSLFVAANYFNYDYKKGYNAEVDTDALMYVYRKIKALKDSGEYEDIIEQNYKVLKASIVEF